MDQTTDSHNLGRFLQAQDPIFTCVLKELRNGSKETHWMWFIFPQIQGLGTTPTSRHFAIASRAEAEAYLAHPTLGPRLRECTTILNSLQGRTSQEVFGSTDSMKFHSSMTLFANTLPDAEAGSDNNAFQQALNKYFGGHQDTATLNLLSLAGESTDNTQ